MNERQTLIWPVDPERPDPELIEKAASIIRSGGLVAFPTETVYGLGANALDPAAVNAIYAAKGRPSRNPLIVHVGDIVDARSLVERWTTTAQSLAERFWPGPLTIVLPHSGVILDEVTGGGATVAVRCPAHPVARALIRAAGVPIAAPSANPSGELSPTLAEHVLRGLAGKIDLILDGGPSWAGIESTVVDLTASIPRLLRPGPIPSSEIEKVVGLLQRQTNADAEAALPSPGMLERHYAPKTPLECCVDFTEAMGKWMDLALARGCVIFLDTETQDCDCRIGSHFVVMPNDPVRYAEQMYRVLHQLDQRGFDRILVVLPPDTDEWLAVRDRLLRAGS